MNIPNLLTIVRFIIIPVFGYYLYIEQYYIALSLFLFSGITDILDGHIARKLNMITSWGKLADPLADKLTQITALLILTIHDKIPVFVLLIIIIKEAFMGTGTIILYKQENVVISANWYGKLATVVFYVAIVLTIFNGPYSKIFIAIAVLAALFAFYMYVLTYRKIKKDLI